MNTTIIPMQNDVHIRLMTEEDLEAVAAVEQECFADPWSPATLALLLNEPNFAFCAELSGEIVGYIGMQSVPCEGQITDIAVKPAFRRRGIANELLSAALDRARKDALQMIFLEVRVSNLPAISLYEHFGFETVGTRRNFYAHPREDAYNMRLLLS